MIEFTLCTQTPGYCGPAALKMALSHYGIEKSEDELARLIGATREAGCEPDQIVSAARALGLIAEYRKNGSIEELKRLVEDDVAVIVDWFSPEENGHYSVVAGFEGEMIVLADPHFGDYNRMPIAAFLNRWFELDEYPPEDPCRFALRELIEIRQQPTA